jgi:prefoldin subunit 5
VSALADSGPIGTGHHPPLGELLVHRGLLTAEQLDAAIAEQGRSQRPLGETLIALGFVSAATIAQALATQHGSLLKTEYGYATGFDSERPAGVAGVPPATVEPPHAVAQVAPPPPPPPPPPLPVVAEPAPLTLPEPAPPELPVEPAPAAVAPVPVTVPPAQADTTAGQVAALEAELAAARDVVRAFAERVQQLEAERDAPRVEVDGTSADQVSALEHRLDEALAQVAALGREREELAAAVSERDAAIERLRSAADSLHDQIGRLGSLEAELAEARTQRQEAALSVDAEAFTNRVAELEDALVVEVAGRNELQAAVAERDARISALEEVVREQPWASSERHLLFFRGDDGYGLVELDGPPPLPGARIDVPGATGPQIVTRVAPAPLPGHALPCAYLVAA